MAALIFDVGVATVVRENDSILLVREATGRYAGKWGIPKGRVDEEETPLDAALRELKEECGIAATIEGLIGMREKYDSNGPAVFLVYSSKDWEGEPKVSSEEVDQVRFVKESEFSKLDWISPAMEDFARSGLYNSAILPITDSSKVRQHPYFSFASVDFERGG